MKYLLILLPLLGNCEIRYRLLTWNDFKGVPPSGTDAMACTCTNIVIGMDTAYAIFIPEKSWTKTKDAELLRHEQLHFAITKKWAETINMWRPYNLVEHSFNENIPVYLTRWHDEEMRYDAETNHGIDSIAQKQWEDKIKL